MRFNSTFCFLSVTNDGIKFKIDCAASAPGKHTPIHTTQKAGMAANAVPLSGIKLLFLFRPASNLVTILTELHLFPQSKQFAKRLLGMILGESLRKGNSAFVNVPVYRCNVHAKCTAKEISKTEMGPYIQVVFLDLASWLHVVNMARSMVTVVEAELC